MNCTTYPKKNGLGISLVNVWVIQLHDLIEKYATYPVIPKIFRFLRIYNQKDEVMSERLTDKFTASLGGYVPATPGWYLREKNSAGENVYHPVMAWRECAGTGPLSDGVLVPVLACGMTGKASNDIGGDTMFVFHEWLTPNGDGTFRDRNF